ncbi:Blue light- and temperature-regulated antirepressor YcgF [Citrobacter freundii]|nr:Blue light- and temperature-regulated antirepressor YcgF [Citrobacter freundii]
MLTTIIYRSHLRDDAPLKALEDMVTAANIKTGDLMLRESYSLTVTTFSNCLKALRSR